MAEYEEFRVKLTPNLGNPGSWSIDLLDCPVAPLVGTKDVVAPSLTRAELRRLRNRNGWPNEGELRAIGARVWQSLMTPTIAPAFHACLLYARSQNKGLRIILVLEGQENESVGSGAIRLAEFPAEVLYTDTHAFLATDLNTPVSRSFRAKPDPPLQVLLPLRVLVVVATPTDKPLAEADVEAQVIRDALEPLAGPNGTFVLEFCTPPTRAELLKRLAAEPWHILHFIGHGGFNIVGDDPTPRAYLSFERANGPESDPLDAATLEVILRNSQVRLVVLTACSSSAPLPDEEPYGTSAFQGIAQRLVAGISGVTATVAMQFDLEADAAVEFTREFYENLRRPDRSLDEVVTLARRAVVTWSSPGHRAWVTPTVYWRCQNGRVFSLRAHRGPNLDADTLAKLANLDGQLAVYRRQLEWYALRSPQVLATVAELIQGIRDDVASLEAARGNLLGETVRLQGGVVRVGQEVETRLSLRLRLVGPITLVRLRVEYPPDKLTFVGARAGQDAGGQLPLTAPPGPGQLDVTLFNPSVNQAWVDREYEIGWLKFAVKPDVQPSVIDLKIGSYEIQRAGQVAEFSPLDGVLFVESDGQ